MRVSTRYRAVTGAVWLILALVSLPDVVKAQETRYNVYTVDRHMPSFGDIVSNWVAARHLAIREGVEVNVYVAPIHHEKFRTILPTFDTREEPYVTEVAPGRTISIYWDGRPVARAERTCNLAFTVDKVDHLSSPVLEQRPGGVGMQPPQVRSSRIYQTLRDTALRGQPSEYVSPFLAFSVPRSSGMPRINLERTRELMLERPPPGDSWWPVVFFESTFLNKQLFVSAKTPVQSVPAGGGIHYLGVAYASSPAVIRDYIARIAQLAEVQPDRRFAVIVPRNVEIGASGPAPEHPWWPDAVDRETVQRVPVADNFAVFVFPDGLPYALSDRFFAAATLPVLVTGTMSLSQAIQHEKPFLYEVMPHLDWIATEIEEFFTGNVPPASILVSGESRREDSPLHERLGPPDEAGITPAVRESRLAARRDRERFMFGVGEDGTVDWEGFQFNYLILRAKTVQYRLSWRPDTPERHMLDDLPRYCGEARRILTRLNAAYARRGRQALVPANTTGVPAQSGLARALSDFEARIVR